jgi:hypothetical protein
MRNIQTVHDEKGRFVRALVPDARRGYKRALAQAGYVRTKRRGRPSDFTDILRLCVQIGKPVYALAREHWVFIAKRSLYMKTHCWHGRADVRLIRTHSAKTGLFLYRFEVTG